MGIPRLRHHLLPFSQTVLLQGRKDSDQEDVPCIESVVIDGPSLVYNIYSRLLSWFSTTSSNIMDALPTCDEVSRGVILYLLHLSILGVEIKSIYFDGALPAQKHNTRITRLENQRRKLEIFCSETKNGFQMSQSTSHSRTVKPENVLRSRASPARFGNVPANPFMVPAVFEDIKHRWNGKNIAQIAGGLPLCSLDVEAFPWAGLTAMVPGEADAYCAYAARLTNSCVLTNDSDLLLYDLGSQGSIVFLDSLELSRWDPAEPLHSQIKAAMLHPSLVARRLGISSLLPLAYELKAQPNIGLVELLRRSKIAAETAERPSYQRFVEEYQNDDCYVQAQNTKQPLGILDTRISELFWQYEFRGKHAAWNHPHVYLPILNEDHTRRCAWVKGRLFRSIGYSILNLSRPVDERSSYITEFVRRGRRIIEDRIPLRDRGWILEQVTSLQGRLKAQINVGEDNLPLESWTIFALCYSFDADAEFTQSDIQRLKRYLKFGYMGKWLEWADIHLTAQVHSVLYSLRVLKQLIGFSDATDTLAMKLRATLQALPPLHDIMNSPFRGIEKHGSDYIIARSSDIFENVLKESQPACSETSAGTAKQEFPHPSVPRFEQGDINNPIAPRKAPANIYELLQEQ